MRLILIIGLAAVLVPSSRPAQSLVGSWNYFGSESGDEVGDLVRSAGNIVPNGGSEVQYADIVVGAPGDMLTSGKEGVIYVFAGAFQGLPDEPYWKFGSGQQGSELGSAIDTGDVDGDGDDDLVAGAHHYKVSFAQEGMVYLFCGPLNPLLPKSDWEFTGNQKWAHVGVSVALAGDVNHDGNHDLLVGAWHWDNPLLYETFDGAVLLFYGDGTCNLGAEPDWVFERDQTAANLGKSLAAAGDVTGDGFDDIVIGAPGYDCEAGEDEGAVFVFFGSDAGLRIDRKPDWSRCGEQAGALFGTSVAAAGDVDGDGLDDIVVGAPGYDGRVENEGAAFVFYGASSPPYLDSRPAWMRTSGQMGSGFGIAVAGAGDVDDDGYEDIVVGAPTYGKSPTVPKPDGAAFIFYGSHEGLGKIPGYTVRGEKADAAFGHSVGTTGDLMGNGSIGIVAGAPNYKINEDPMGMAAAFYGPLIPTYYQAYLPLVRH